MSEYMEFKNPGEIPVNAFKLLGASTKRDDSSKIGFFGSGLKYAMAVMLREGIDFKVFIGEKELKIGTRQTDFAGRKIAVITVNGEKTSITVDAGIDWEAWFAIREVYSNTIDGGGNAKLATTIQGTPGHTSIFIEISDKLGDVSKNWSHYFAFKRGALFEENGNRILPKLKDERMTMFRKGIRVHHDPKKSLFDYDIDDIEINESRVVKFSFRAYQAVGHLLGACNNLDVIKKFITVFRMPDSSSFYESYTELWELYRARFSEEWVTALDGRRIVPLEVSGLYGVTENTVVLPSVLVKRLRDQFGDRLNFVGYSNEKYIVTGEYDNRLDDSYNLLVKNGIAYDKEKIKIGKFQDDQILGQHDSDNDIIVLSEKIFTPAYRGKQTHILLHEMTHALSGAGDRSDEFSGFLVDTIIGLMETRR